MPYKRFVAMAGGDDNWKWNDNNNEGSLKENALPAESRARLAREPLSNSCAMTKLQATFGTLQSQLHHLSKREQNIPADKPSSAAAAFGGMSKPLPHSVSSMPAHHHAASAAAAAAAHNGGPTVTLLQQVPAPANECILGAAAMGGSGKGGGMSVDSGPLFEFSSRPGTSQVLRHAVEVFEDPDLLSLCDDGLNKQLTRTRDGATESSRIQELAGTNTVSRRLRAEGEAHHGPRCTRLGSHPRTAECMVIGQ